MVLGSASVINSSVKVACYEPFFPTAVQSCWVFFVWVGFLWLFFLPIVKYAEMVMKGFWEILSVEVDVHVTLFPSYLLR